MNIHNYLSDVLLSFRVLFDSVIFRPDFIRSYEFSIANRSFTLSSVDYRPAYEFPACIITFNSDNPSFGERPSVIQKLPIMNTNNFPVIYDSESERVIYLQEEQTQIMVSVVFNCESQLQAKEIEFRVRRFLPLNKYIQLFQFTSFLEIPERLLLSQGIDFNDHEITNLYTRMNKNTGSVDYCFSMRYEPLLRLDSSTVTIADSTQRSFPVNLEIMYQIQMPMWISFEHLPGLIESIHMDFTSFGHEPISENSTRPMNKNKDDIYDGKKRLIKRNLLIHDLSDHEFSEFVDADKVSFAIKFRTDDFVISEDYRFDIFDVDGNLHTNVEAALVDTELNKVIFEFTIDDYNAFYEASLTKPIIVQFIEIAEE